MGPHAERLLHPFATARAILGGETRRDGYHRDGMQHPIVSGPSKQM
jgi:hypothetical protein